MIQLRRTHPELGPIWIYVDNDGNVETKPDTDPPDEPKAATPRGCCVDDRYERRCGVVCYADCGCPVVTKAAWNTIRSAWRAYRQELRTARRRASQEGAKDGNSRTR